MAWVLAVDLGSGGVTAALAGADLEPVSMGECSWEFVSDPAGADTLSAATVRDAVSSAVRIATDGRPRPDVLVLASMMHTLVVTDSDGTPRSPIFTWNDRRTHGPTERIREDLGNYRERTGCHVHPSFPAFRLAWLGGTGSPVLDGDFRVASLRSHVQRELTGCPDEDVSTASASGLMDLETGSWDPVTLEGIGIDPVVLPRIVDCSRIVGGLTPAAAKRLGLPEGLPVVAGAGDGFLATLGSGCDRPAEVAATLGTTAGVRRWVPAPDSGADPRTFCYRYRAGAFLSGCASSNGGNALEWAADALGPPSGNGQAADPPVFLPFLNGERAPFWDASLRPRWIGTGRSTADLRASVPESLSFMMAAHLELITSGEAPRPERLVLSGNGFRFAAIAPLVAALVPVPVLLPREAGLATIRGAARCGFRALEQDTTKAATRLLETAAPILPSPVAGLERRYERFLDAYRTDPPASR